MATNWRQEIDDLLKHEGFEKKAPGLSAQDQEMIQNFLDNTARLTCKNICDQLNSFQNVRAEIVPSKKLPDSIIQPFELSIYKIAQPKLTYRFHFTKKDTGLYVTGEYSIPNIYGENTRFQATNLNRPLAAATEDDLAADFFFILKSKF